MTDQKAQFVVQAIREDRGFFVEHGVKFGLILNTAILIAQAFVQFVSPVMSFYTHLVIEIILVLAVLPQFKQKVEPVVAVILLPLVNALYLVKFYVVAHTGSPETLLPVSWSYLVATVLMILFASSPYYAVPLAIAAVAGSGIAMYGVAPIGRFLVLHAIGVGVALVYMRLRVTAMRRTAELEYENKRLIEQELEFAATSQRLLLPKESDVASGGWVMASHFEAAGKVSGDWWWNRAHEGALECAIGDVAGHGGGAAMIAAMAVGAWRGKLSGGGSSLAESVSTLGDLLRETGGRHGKTTLSLVRCKGDAVHWWSAGAPPVLLLRTTGLVETHFAPGSPLGYPEAKVAEREFKLAPGERLLLFSDGVSELKDARARELGIGRLSRYLALTAGKPTSQARTQLRDQVSQFAGGCALEDDVTFLVIDRAS